ncbi:hypothetical protein [Actinoplanes awajinensis]|uniref:Uncharacterized protein n=1 Tax=Actinoplanes awajinensis subsp. mycoplanecinus TaxID=135947 RepID=A0A117MLA3_9ACTN|nr:hypothetical protein [Actinoplanes awajinensis]KUL23545.1 hypothetical protein ADL15_46100 [Actinoplanes awajinensis subsp. mycoplanecinus]
MRIGRRLLGVAVAGLVLVIALGAIALVRWKAAGVAHALVPPTGAATPSFLGPEYERDVADRGALIALRLRSDRGRATVRSYAMPPGSPWLQSRELVATQLDHWEQVGDCADDLEATIVECTWREPTRWWPREVALTMMRLPSAGKARSDRTGATFVIIGSGVGG